MKSSNPMTMFLEAQIICCVSQNSYIVIFDLNLFSQKPLVHRLRTLFGIIIVSQPCHSRVSCKNELKFQLFTHALSYTCIRCLNCTEYECRIYTRSPEHCFMNQNLPCRRRFEARLESQKTLS